MPKYKINYGGWYQRTTLHLSEVYNLFAFAFTKTELNKEKLKKLQEGLNLKTVSREVGYLEFVRALTHDNIEIRYYEDGLYILELDSDDIFEGQKILADYFENKFNPTINYLFSLGAPTPKVLANIKLDHPTVVTLENENPEEFYLDSERFGKVYSQLSSGDTTVFKTQNFIFMVFKPHKTNNELMEMQIFFREFKDQLEKYLNIHRKVWEEISDIKERKQIRGKDIRNVRTQLDKYQKAISLISNRIKQMESYVVTRRSIAQNIRVEQHLNDLFQYKFETLTDTRDYIAELWEMTTNYLNSAIQVLVELKNQSTKDSISSLTVITTIGVVAAILGYLATDSLPKITLLGGVFFLILIIVTWSTNRLISVFYKNRRYKLTMNESEKNL